jgi:hypothetical protein
MTTAPWWADIAKIVGGAIVGYLLTQLASSSSWRRDVVLPTMQDLRRVHTLTWAAGNVAADRLETQLGDLSARLAFLGFPSTEVDQYLNSATRLQRFMEWEVLDEGEGEPTVFAHPRGVPEGLTDDVRNRALELERELLLQRTLGGRVRVRWIRRRRRRAALRAQDAANRPYE